MDHSVAICNHSLSLIQEIGRMEDRDGVLKHPDRVMPDLHVFVYVTRGRLQVIEDGEEFILTKGNYLFLRKNVHHWGDDFYQSGSNWFYIHFYDNASSESLPEYNIFGKTSLIHQDEYHTKVTMPKSGKVAHTGYAEAQLDQLMEWYESQHPMRPMLLSMHAHQFFLELYTQRLEAYTNKKSNRMVAKMIQLMDEHDDHKLASDEIADTLGMNYAYLSTIFKEQTGKSVTQYQNERIIEKAIHLFRKENYNVSEVSDLLGFANPFYFSRVFKKITGMSPSVYLKQIYRG
ncbi:AraC family transcriptional regulator [Gracilibacillus salinarum]|uniref:AraC family transcriptional regulator n=1 Tax=Gracilibacillus salinarum TaxID=2932255 RepID=A0ABY4GPP6_9BACI|nr:AraC family transcriptional regulator [Gracilibacillus salinarum]UOQ86368.1 AraC family transcriptional regulator [Gracilibacillus salinarum]